MKALVLTGTRQMKKQEISDKPVTSNEVKVKVMACGICGTDKHLFQGLPGSAQADPPIVLGHENSGIVTAIGPEVKSDFKPGDRVTIDPNIPCGYCDFCHEDKPQLCENNEAIGVTRNGGMAEYVYVPETNVYKIPDNLSFGAAAMAEPVSCAVHGLRSLDIRPSQSVLVIGDGFMGQVFLELLAKRGLKKVDVSGHNPKKVNLLKTLGADVVFNPEETRHDEKYDVIIECVGLPVTQEQAIQSARRGGQILMFGVAGPNDTISLNAYDVYFNELTIKGAFINPYAMRDAIRILSDKTVDAERLITHRLKLDDVPDVLAGNINEKITKAIILMDRNA
ncbi:zinc-dependent alcohol dehydrogenase family protein [Sporolactobacillus sp. Y61]|jgi:2-desacetyl-2-hydroxyethyl bacteriochlorophyllide A dehydrogenase|uniref:Zinc-dependent alcohol dehydrogenase family protein n=1 Tax=Sporolactobacillus sp. Y61 TaxID=3160863 RepID=A0AAU8ID08_9BACL|nr:zinc-dependent alcohol dehydrogenase family protein [Sporolactobacillus sp. THM19-2]RYL93296.1 alcohol dehydrogenase [Sporolactobacillus sp. THM19-2]